MFDALRDRFQLRFRSRVDAGRMLAELLENKVKGNNGEQKLVIAIPRGGTIVADGVAKRLFADFNILITKKLLLPGSEENALGAMTEFNSTYINQVLVEELKITQDYVQKDMAAAYEEIKRRIEVYRRDAVLHYDVNGRVVILVDDGAATGATLIAAARWLRSHAPKILYVAIPVAPKNTLDLLKSETDRLEAIIKESNSHFKTVEQFYQNFPQVTDEEVIRIMSEWKK